MLIVIHLKLGLNSLLLEGSVEPVYSCYECESTDYQGYGEYIRKIANLEQIIKEQEQTLEELKEKIKTSCN